LQLCFEQSPEHVVAPALHVTAQGGTSQPKVQSHPFWQVHAWPEQSAAHVRAAPQSRQSPPAPSAEAPAAPPAPLPAPVGSMGPVPLPPAPAPPVAAPPVPPLAAPPVALLAAAPLPPPAWVNICPHAQATAAASPATSPAKPRISIGHRSTPNRP
jgi:hypothetical protein